MVLNHRWRSWAAALALLFPDATQSALAAELHVVQIGSLNVAGGQLKACAVGYRTYGTLAADKSNVVLFPTGLNARTANLEKWIGPGRLVDSSRWYVITVDALGNGVSCSPSNSRSAPYRAFPDYTIRDMVRAQHKLLTLNLGIDHLSAIVGIGMGGMQALQWAVMYQDFADRLVLIDTSMQPTAQDHARWDGQLQGMVAGGQPAVSTFDSYRQLQAVRAFDLVGAGELAGLVNKIKARMLIITSATDSWVAPEPSRLLAVRARNSHYLRVDRLCAESASGCEGEAMMAVGEFLRRP